MMPPEEPVGMAPDDPIAAHLSPWVDAGVLTEADSVVASALCHLANEETPDVWLAVALAFRGHAHGHVAVDPAQVRRQVLTQIEHHGRCDPDTIRGLAWPVEPERWLDAVAQSPLVPELVVVERGLIYLRRSNDQERRVARWFLSRASAAETTSAPLTPGNIDAIAAALRLTDEQRSAVLAAASTNVAVLTGGPGMGKTTTVAALLAALIDGDTSHRYRIALAAPTGRAAARLGESIQAAAATLSAHNPSGRGSEFADALNQAQPSTIHSMLGIRRDGSVRYHRDHPLPFQVVIVDETSMVSLELMDALLDAIGPDTRLVLVGDANQLPSIDAGSVLGDLAEAARTEDSPLYGLVHELTINFRYPSSSRLGRLAAAVNAGDPDQAWAVLSETSSPTPTADHREVVVSFTNDPAEATRTVTAAAETLRQAALAGDAERALGVLESSRVICAHNRGPVGVAHWNELGQSVVALDNPTDGRWHIGRPVMITANDSTTRVVNGDHGVSVTHPDGSTTVALRAAGNTVRLLSPSQLPPVVTSHAITIHKSQGSEFDHVVVVLPPADSLLATRQLLYTAITRARMSLQLIGTETALRNAVANDTERHSGLLSRLTDPTARHASG